MSYLGQTGKLGEYHGIPVYGMSRRSYDESGAYEEDRIYCLTDDDKEDMQLIFKNQWIGNMTPEGEITEFYNAKMYARRYLPEKFKKNKTDSPKKEKKREEKVERGKRVEVKPMPEFAAASVDEILTAAMNDNWYKELMYND